MSPTWMDRFYARIERWFDPGSSQRNGSSSGVSAEKGPEFREALFLTPSPRWSRLLLWTLSGGTLGLLIWACVARMDETIVLPGQLERVRSELLIRSPDDGFLQSDLVSTHQQVAKNDVLFILSSADLDLKVRALQQRLHNLRNQRLSTSNTLKLRRDQLTRKIALHRDLLQRMQRLQTQGAIQEFQVLEKKAALSDAISDRESLSEELSRSELAIDLQISDAMSSLKQLEQSQRRFTIRAPEGGQINTAAIKSTGDRIQAGETLATLIPKEQLIAVAQAPSRLSAALQAGNRAAISIDAFPSQDYGTLEATLLSISPTTSSVGSEKNAERAYSVRLAISPNQDNQRLKLSALQPGMAISTRIHLRDRRVISLVFDFLDRSVAPLGEKR
jgi:multidrug efflux pump subunit AcrA (membrane-fusion protein)